MHLLVVEDSPGQAALVAAQLHLAAPGEFVVETAGSLAAAVDRLLGDGIDCVLLDLGLPDAQDLEALDRVLTASLGAPVVVFSGHTDEALALAAIHAGAQDFLVKGRVDGDILARALRYAVERGRIGRELARAALHDPLTRLPNRTLFFDRLRQALSRLGRTRTCLAVMFLDLDAFKAVNDRDGHAAGDALLIEVGMRLGGVLRGGDTAARIGGDEFVVLCEDVSGGEEARLIGARVLGELGVPASMGIALAHGGDQDAETLVREADAAMYRAKRAGGAGLEVAGGGPAALRA